MAVKGKALADRFTRWHLLLDNVGEHLAEMPWLKEDVRELEEIDGQAKGLVAEIASLRARAQEATAELRKLADRGDRVRSRIGASLRGRYGFTSGVLIRFGFKPRPRSNRAAANLEAWEEQQERAARAAAAEPTPPEGAEE